MTSSTITSVHKRPLSYLVQVYEKPRAVVNADVNTERLRPTPEKEANVRLRPTSEKRQTVTSVAANNYLLYCTSYSQLLL